MKTGKIISLVNIFGDGMNRKLKRQLQNEIDSSFLYQKLAEHYQDKTACQILSKLSQIEDQHAQKLVAKIQLQQPKFTAPKPSLRARIQVKLANWIGYDNILADLAATEWQISKNMIAKKEASGFPITGFENLHLHILKNLAKHEDIALGKKLLSGERKHKTFLGGNELRAGVLGANDGLVSNLSLVMGVAGALRSHNDILVAGLAGLLAGAISMALGEWLSVQSSRELYQLQVEIEAEELETSPEEEMTELALLYAAKGMDEDKAKKLAQEVMSNKETALNTLVREELGIDRMELGGSAWKAAIASFMLFAFGALLPVLPFFFDLGKNVIPISLIVSTCGLFALGSTITLFTGRNMFYSGTRQVIFGLVAAAITFMIGKLIGLSLAG